MKRAKERKIRRKGEAKRVNRTRLRQTNERDKEQVLKKEENE